MFQRERLTVAKSDDLVLTQTLGAENPDDNNQQSGAETFNQQSETRPTKAINTKPVVV